MRIVAPALLVLGVVVSTVFFVRQQPTVPGSTAPPAAAANMPADAAHAAAGVDMGGAAGDVAARFQQQVEALQAELAATPADRSLVLRLAQFLHDGHRVADAVPLYRRAMELDPTDPQPYYDLAAAYGSMADWDAAGGVLEERLDQDGGDVVALYDLGAVRANQGLPEEARQLLVRARAATTDGALLARISEALARLKGI